MTLKDRLVSLMEYQEGDMKNDSMGRALFRISFGLFAIGWAILMLPFALLKRVFRIRSNSDPDTHVLRYFVVLLAVFLLAPSVSASLTDGLTAYYSFNGTYADATGQNANMSLVSAVTLENEAVINQSIYFSVAGESVSFPNQDISGDISVSFWLKTTSTSSRGFFSTYDGSTTTPLRIAQTSGSALYAQLNDGTTAITAIASGTTHLNGSWGHIVAVRDAGTILRLYFNGVEVANATDTLTTDLTNSVGAWTLNKYAWTSGGGAIAYMDELAIYNRTLNSTEVSALYNSGSGLSYPFSSGEPEPTMGNTSIVGGSGARIYDTDRWYVNGETTIGSSLSGYDNITCERTFNGGSSWFSHTNTGDYILNSTFVGWTAFITGGDNNNGFRCKEDDGNWSYGGYLRTIGDDDAPSISYDPTNASSVESYNVSVSVSDALSGLNASTIEYCSSNSGICTPDTAGSDTFSVTFDTIGSWTICTYAEDNLGNDATTCSATGAFNVTEPPYSQYILFSCSELYTNNALSCSDPGDKEVGTYSSTVEASGYFNKSASYNVTEHTTSDSFTYEGDWLYPERLNDGNASTGTTVDIGIGGATTEGSAYWNFTGNYTGRDGITFKDDEGEHEETLPSACLINPQIRVTVTRPEIGGGTNWYCHNGTDWSLIRGSSGFFTAYGFATEAKGIGISGFYSLNLTVTASAYEELPSLFNVSLTNAELGLSFFNSTDGSGITYSLLSGYEYALNVNQTGEAEEVEVAPYYENVTNTTAPPQSRSVSVVFGAARTLDFSYYYEENLSVFDKNVTLRLTPIDDTTTTFYEVTSDNGTSQLVNIAVGEYQIVMSSEGYHDEYRYINLGVLTSAEFDAYFRTNDTGSVKTFNVVDRRNLPQNGWYLKAQRYYNATGWVTVDEGRSNIDGRLLINLLSDEFYRVILLDDDFTVQYTSSRTFLPSDTYEVSPSLTTTTNSQIDKVRGLTTALNVKTHPNATLYFEADGYSTSGSRDWKLELYRYYTDGPALIGSTNASGDAVTLTLDVPNATARYEAVLSIVGSKIPVSALGYTYGGGASVLGTGGGVFAFLLLIAIVGVGTFSAPVAIVMSIVALIVANLIGIFSIGVASIIGLIFAGGLILFRRNA